MTILLVRHAESKANIDHRVSGETADHAIPLSDKGRTQAAAVGTFINDFYKANPPKSKVRLWSSPYIRTTQTTLILRDHAPDVTWDFSARGVDIHFDERLREREWGAHQFMDYKKEGGSNYMRENDPAYFAHFHRVWEAPQGRYFFRPKGGESAADIASRLRSFFHDLYYDIGRGINEHVIVMHGMSMLAFIYAFTKAHPLFFDEEEIGANTCVRLLDKDSLTGRYADYGYIYDPDKNVYLLNKPEKPIIRNVTEKLSGL